MFWCDKGTSVDGMFLVWPALRRDVALVEGGGRCVCPGAGGERTPAVASTSSSAYRLEPHVDVVPLVLRGAPLARSDGRGIEDASR